MSQYGPEQGVQEVKSVLDNLLDNFANTMSMLSSQFKASFGASKTQDEAIKSLDEFNKQLTAQANSVNKQVEAAAKKEGLKPEAFLLSKKDIDDLTLQINEDLLQEVGFQITMSQNPRDPGFAQRFGQEFEAQLENGGPRSSFKQREGLTDEQNIARQQNVNQMRGEAKPGDSITHDANRQEQKAELKFENKCRASFKFKYDNKPGFQPKPKLGSI